MSSFPVKLLIFFAKRREQKRPFFLVFSGMEKYFCERLQLARELLCYRVKEKTEKSES